MPEIVVQLGGQELQRLRLDKDQITIGRASDNDIVIENLSVSRRHAIIDRKEGAYLLSDQGSANGTSVNGVPITQTRIYDQDKILIGKHSMLFQAPEAPPENMSQKAETLDNVEQTIVLERPKSRGFLTIRCGKQRGAVHEVVTDGITIGRANDNDVRIVDWFVQPHQAAIERRSDTFVFQNLAGETPVKVNGVDETEHELSEGDILSLGTSQIVFTTRPESAEAARDQRVPEKVGGSSSWETQGEEVEVSPLTPDQPPPMAPTEEGVELEEPADAFIEQDDEEVGIEIEEAVSEEPTDVSAEPEPPVWGDPLGGVTEEYTEEQGIDIEEDDDLQPSAPEEVETGPDTQPVREDDGEEMGELLEIEDFDINDISDEPVEEISPLFDTGKLEAAEVEAPEENDHGQEPEPMFAFDEEEPPSEETPETEDPEETPEADEPLVDFEETPASTFEDQPETEETPVLEEESIEIEEFTDPLAEEDSEVSDEAPSEEEPVDALSDKDAKAIAMWEKALSNPSPAVQKQAHQQLKRLTGRDYD